MKECKTIRFTYEDVRHALAALHSLDIQGIKLCHESGYVVESCSLGQQPVVPGETEEAHPERTIKKL